MSPRSTKRARIGKVSPKTVPPRSAKTSRIGKVSSKTMPLRLAKRARTGKVSPKTKEAAVKVEEVIVSIFEAKGEIKAEHIIENKPVVAVQAMPPRSAKRVRIGKVSPKTRVRIGKVSPKTRVRIDKVSPKTKVAATVKVEEVVVSVFEAKGEIKVEEIIENKPDEEKPSEPEPNPLQLKEACIREAEHQAAERWFLECFCHLTRYYAQYFDFCDYLKNECKFIKPDSVPKEVYNSGELPLSRFDLLMEDVIIDLLHRYSCTMGSKAAETIDLESQYSVYLSECDFITCDSNVLAILGILKEEEKFKEKKFSSLRDDRLMKDLLEYIRYLDGLRCIPKIHMGRSFSEVMKKRIEMRNYVEWPPLTKASKEMRLVHRAHSKKYTMDEDPFTEMIKLYPNPSDRRYC